LGARTIGSGDGAGVFTPSGRGKDEMQPNNAKQGRHKKSLRNNLICTK